MPVLSVLQLLFSFLSFTQLSLWHLEKIIDDINSAIAVNNMEKIFSPEKFDENKAAYKISVACLHAQTQLKILFSKAEYLRSKKYRFIKSYLLTRLNKTNLATARFEINDPEPVVQYIRELLADIDNYLYHRYGFANHLHLIWQTTVAIVTRNTLTVEEKTLLAEIVRNGGSVSKTEIVGFDSDTHKPVNHIDIDIGRNISIRRAAARTGKLLISTLEQFVAAFTKLQQRTLIRQVSSETFPFEDKNLRDILESGAQETITDFVLTGDGWWTGLKYAENEKYTLSN